MHTRSRKVRKYFYMIETTKRIKGERWKYHTKKNFKGFGYEES
jgi:hypothetical protein